MKLKKLDKDLHSSFAVQTQNGIKWIINVTDRWPEVAVDRPDEDTFICKVNGVQAAQLRFGMADTLGMLPDGTRGGLVFSTEIEKDQVTVEFSQSAECASNITTRIGPRV